MTTRNEAARICQSGASNPRPMIQALANAINDCYAEGVAPNEDPAVFLILHQLCWALTGSTPGSQQHWEDAMKAVGGQP